MFSVELDVECVCQGYLEIVLEKELSDRCYPCRGEIWNVDGRVLEKRNAEPRLALHVFDIQSLSEYTASRRYLICEIPTSVRRSKRSMPPIVIGPCLIAVGVVLAYPILFIIDLRTLVCMEDRASSSTAMAGSTKLIAGAYVVR